MKDEMVERAAAALVQRMLAVEINHDTAGEVVRTVIAAMREPTKDMLDAGVRAIVSDKRVWPAMVDAALGKSRDAR